MGSRVRDLFTRRATSQPLPEAPARKPAVQVTALPKAPVAAVVRPGLGNVSLPTRDEAAARARAPGAEPLTCGCGRTALDVRIDRDGTARCFAGVGCQGKAERARGAV